MRPFTHRLAVLTLILAAAACGEDDAAPSVASPDVAATTTAGGTEATASTAVLVDGGQVTTTTTASASDDRLVLRNDVLLEVGGQYVVGPDFEDDQTTITFTADTVASTSYIVPGLLLLSRETDVFAAPQISILQANTAYSTVYTTPAVDLSALVTADDLVAVSQLAPSDFIGWLSAQSYVEITAVTDTEFGGHPARKVDYAYLETPGLFPCFADRDDGCIWVYGSWDTSLTYFAGDTGSYYEVDVAGDRFIVDVQNRAGAAEIAATIRFEPASVDVPDELAAALDLPVGRPTELQPNAEYRWQASTGDWIAFTSPTNESVGFSELIQTIGDHRSMFVSAKDSSAGVDIVNASSLGWWPQAVEQQSITFADDSKFIDYLNDIPLSPLPTDLFAALATLDHLAVTAPSGETVGDVSVTFIDVTVDPDVAGLPCPGNTEPDCLYLFGHASPLTIGETVRLGLVAGPPGDEQVYIRSTTDEFAVGILQSLRIIRPTD